MNRLGVRRLSWSLLRLSGNKVLPSCSFRGARAKTLEPKPFDDIPGARGLPVVGSLLDYIFYKGGISKARVYLPQERVKQFGNIYREVMGTLIHVNIADPEEIEFLLREEPLHPMRTNVPLFQYFFKHYNREPGVFFLDGVEWYKHRSVLSKRILVPRNIHQYAPEMNKISSEFVERVEAIRVPPGSETSYEVENIDYELFKWSFESVTFVIFEKRFEVFGSNMDPKAREFIEATGGFLGSIIPTVFLPPELLDYYHTKSFRKFASCFDKMYELAQGFIVQRLQELEKEEELSSKDDSEVGLLQYLLFNKNLTNKDVLCSTVDLLFAGVDTTSNTMQWVLYELAKNPDKQALLFDEISSVLCARSEVAPNDLKELPYLKAVVKETLRLHPVLGEIPRVLPEDRVIAGYHIPAGTQLFLMSYVMGRDPNLFDEPESFSPERWLRGKEGNVVHKFGSIPFGFGTRMCIGRRLAELEMHILLVRFLLKFHLEYPANQTMGTVARGTLIPEKPVRVKFITREKP